MKPEVGPDGLDRVPTVQEGNTQARRFSLEDAVFGIITDDGPNYRNVGWLGTVALMMKTQIGLGVLSIPAVFDVLGLIPGVICLLVIAGITTWSDYMVGMFKLRHREIYSIDDAGALMFGQIGRYILGAAFVLYWVFVAGSGMLGISIGLNAVSTHGACTAVFVAVAAIAGCGLGSIQTLGRISWLAWLGLTCILTAIVTLTIAVGVQSRPSAAPPQGAWSSDYKLFNNPSFSDASAALSSLVFAYAGTPGFFAIVSEMRDPRHYTRSLLVCQSGVTAIYITVGCVVYYYCGSYVASPALGSAGHLMKKICYGFALPGLLVTTTLVIHVASKYLFVHILRGSKHLASPTLVHWATWFGCTMSIAVVAFIIASSIPVFGSLVSLVGALLGTLLSFQPMGCMWLYDNWKKGKTERSARWILMVCYSVFVVVIGSFLMIVGTYGSVVGIINSYNQSGGSAPSYGSAELLRRRYQKHHSTPEVDAKTERARTIKRMKLSGYGIAACTLAIIGTIALYPQDAQSGNKSNTIKLDAPPSIAGALDKAEVEQVPTGTSTIPTFPRTIHISTDAPSSTPAAANEGTQSNVEYQVVGLGIRTVSLLSIQVYVVGMYIATSDIAALQERLVHAVADPVATTLVPEEKSKLKELLRDPGRGEDVWNEIVKDAGIRTAFRIVPTRNTDFMHLRDGFVRGITARSAHFANDKKDTTFQNESFGEAMGEFKSAFGGGARRKLAKGEVLLLARDGQGKMTVWEEDKQGNRVKMGTIADERVGRLLWLNYLAGKNVSSEPARQSVIDGVMDYVERPVGTVATQVV